MIKLIVIAIAVIVCRTNHVLGLTCFQCSRIDEPRYCLRVLDCAEGEVCTVERTTNEFREVVYNLGCNSATGCRNISSTGATSPCSECCSTDLCNNEACGEQGYPHTRGPICYSCTSKQAGRCHDVDVCKNGQVCNIVGHDIFGETTYTSNCAFNNDCTGHHGGGIIVGKRSVDDEKIVDQEDTSVDRRSTGALVCDKCCTTDLCNKECTVAVAVNGNWEVWSDWTHCSATCGNGTQSRVRSCTNPMPSNGGVNCTGAPVEYQTCLVRLCTVNGNWSSWASWSPCSANYCENGTTTRRRFCNNPTPLNGGKNCTGVSIESKQCLNYTCPAADCLDILRFGVGNTSGVYTVRTWKSLTEIQVYCDQTTQGGGWTVVQRRFDGSVDFNRTFAQYEHGFGNISGEFWQGLIYTQEMTSRYTNNTLRFDLQAPNGTWGFDEYSGFSLSPGIYYTFHVGPRTDSLGMYGRFTLSNGTTDGVPTNCAFSTPDRDQDKYSGNCAADFDAGWWYNSCYNVASINGHYVTPDTRGGGVIYEEMTGYDSVSLNASSMMFRGGLK